jgi:hypothetical protein
MRMKINNNTKPNNKTRWSDKKQSWVHKVPGGVAILSHVCGVAAIILHTLKVCVSGKYGETRNSCLLLVENRMVVAT